MMDGLEGRLCCDDGSSDDGGCRREEEVDESLFTPPFFSHSIDPFLFSPCGFSMNTISSTISSTPSSLRPSDDPTTSHRKKDGEIYDGGEIDDCCCERIEDFIIYSTTHITPQPSFSYASWEVGGNYHHHTSSSPSLGEYVDKVVDQMGAIVREFRPKHFSIQSSLFHFHPPQFQNYTQSPSKHIVNYHLIE